MCIAYQIQDVKSIKNDGMEYFRSFHSYLQVLSKEDLKGTRIEHGFKQAFMSLFGQDVITFPRIMPPQRKSTTKSNLTKDAFQKMDPLTSCGVVNNQFPKSHQIAPLSNLGNVRQSIAKEHVIKDSMKERISGPIYDEEQWLRSKTTEQITSLLANNAELKAQIQGKVEPIGRISVCCRRWIPIGKLFDSCTSNVDSELPHGSNVDIPNIHECKQTLDVSAYTSINVSEGTKLDLSAGTLCNVKRDDRRVMVAEKAVISKKPLFNVDSQ
ncbi:hypothetical protein Tco_0045444 [Tanacetum coccineum]